MGQVVSPSHFATKINAASDAKKHEICHFSRIAVLIFEEKSFLGGIIIVKFENFVFLLVASEPLGNEEFCTLVAYP